MNKEYEIKLNLILDKVNKSGAKSLTKIEKKFLEAYSKSDENELNYLEYVDHQKTFTSNDGNLTFKYSHLKYEDEAIHYYGYIIVPDLILKNGKIIDGEIWGYIMAYGKGEIKPIFTKKKYDVLDFCSGIEYELDFFLEYVIFTIDDEKPK